MTPEFAKGIDPLIKSLLRIRKQGSQQSVSDYKHQLVEAFDQASRRLDKHGKCWEHAKFALVCWIDSEIISIHPTWKDEVLEAYYFSSGRGSREFFVRAEQAYRDRCLDALEVFLLCFLFGFRGVYQDQSHIPKDLPRTEILWQESMIRRLEKKWYRPQKNWHETVTWNPEQGENTGWATLVNTGLFCLFAFFCLTAVVLSDYLVPLLGK